MKRLIVCMLLVMSFNANAAGNIVINGEVTHVTNTYSNADVFSVRTTGGTGNCTGGSVIEFPRTLAASQKAHDRAYAAALTALTTGMKVTIYTYESGTDCTKAAYILINKP